MTPLFVCKDEVQIKLGQKDKEMSFLIIFKYLLSIKLKLTARDIGTE